MSALPPHTGATPITAAPGVLQTQHSIVILGRGAKPRIVLSHLVEPERYQRMYKVMAGGPMTR
jgi:hypothetical protein